MSYYKQWFGVSSVPSSYKCYWQHPLTCWHKLTKHHNPDVINQLANTYLPLEHCWVFPQMGTTKWIWSRLAASLSLFLKAGFLFWLICGVASPHGKSIVSVIFNVESKVSVRTGETRCQKFSIFLVGHFGLDMIQFMATHQGSSNTMEYCICPTTTVLHRLYLLDKTAFPLKASQ